MAALLHKICVDSYYRILNTYVMNWHYNTRESIIQKTLLVSWQMIHRANRHLKENMSELNRVLNLVNHNVSSDETLVSPQTTKIISALNEL